MIFNLMATLLVASSIGAPIYKEASFEVAPTAHYLELGQQNDISLTAEEATNGVYENFFNWLIDKGSEIYSTFTISYDGKILTFDNYDEVDGFCWQNLNNSIWDYKVWLNASTQGEDYEAYHFTLESYADDVIPIERELTLNMPTSALVEEAYAIIEDDLTTPTITENIFSTIGETITGMINNLSSALGGVTGLFWNNAENKLTVLGVLSVIAVGAGVVYFVFRLIRGLLSSGARA